nr:hypothetical protein [uncultured Psychroserpens sp.]
MRLLVFLLLFSVFGFSQYDYDTSKSFPFGNVNPLAPKQTKDYQALIGLCQCKSTSRKQDGTWAKPIDMTWKWKYIMNGMAVQDGNPKNRWQSFW